MNTQKITPSLWFDKNAEEAINFYISLFPASKLISLKRYPDEVPVDFMKGFEGKVLTGIFELAGYRFMALDGGPLFKLNPSISFMVNFDPSQDSEAKTRIDKIWEKLSEGGKVLMPLDKYPFSERYGWVQDKYGVSWQLILTNPEGEERPIVIPSLLFVSDTGEKAEAATDFYISVFAKAPFDGAQGKRGTIARYPAGVEPNKEGSVMFTDFVLAGQWFTAMDGSASMHNFNFNEAVSLYVECETQEEVDYFWGKLSAVPESEQCGWVKDKYGVSWQIIPKQLGELLGDADQEKSGRAMAAMLKMKKIDIKGLHDAFEGK